MSPRHPYARLASPRRFSREWLFESLRTLGWVMLITVLIWVYADIEHTAERDVSATLRIGTEWSGQPVALEAPVQFHVKGNDYAIERFVRNLAEGGSVMSYYPPRPAEPGTRLEPTADILASIPAIQHAGLQVVSAEPAGVDINEAFRVLTGVAVRFDSSGADLAEAPRIEPDRVELRVPVNQLSRIDLSKLTVSTATLDLRDLPWGEPVGRDVEVLAPSGPAGVRVLPPKVHVTFKVLQPTDTRKITVPVQVQAPRSWEEDDTWSRYRLVVKDPLEWTKQLTVLGNRADLAKLRPEDVQACITLTEDDKQRVESWLPGEVKVRFPPQLRVSLAEAPLPVNYRLTKRQESPAPAP